MFLLALHLLLEGRCLLLVLEKDNQVACRCILVVRKLRVGKILLLRVGELASGQVGFAVELVDLVPVGVQRRVADCCVVAGLDHGFREGLTTGITGKDSLREIAHCVDPVRYEGVFSDHRTDKSVEKWLQLVENSVDPYELLIVEQRNGECEHRPFKLDIKNVIRHIGRRVVLILLQTFGRCPHLAKLCIKIHTGLPLVIHVLACPCVLLSWESHECRLALINRVDSENTRYINVEVRSLMHVDLLVPHDVEHSYALYVLAHFLTQCDS